MVIDPRELLRTGTANKRGGPMPAQAEPPSVPLGGTKAERLQRLQIGGFGILAMVLAVALAQIVMSRAQETQDAAVPEAAPTVVVSESAAPRDPLAEAGIVPELSAEPIPSPSTSAAPVTGDLPPPAGQNAPLQ
ncbi:MAG: hypothetical protein P1U62_09780 [Alteraurantiacibacter sp. bin_em_oilr2.035]|nr:hypothetical protein [Alteraurantiacibacter sp. bin_em_oilr2.035]